MTAKMTLEEIEGLVKRALLEGIAIATHREDLLNPWENGERAWNGSRAKEEAQKIAREQRETIRKLQQFSCEACADADSCDRVGRSTNRQCAAFRVGTKK